MTEALRRLIEEGRRAVDARLEAERVGWCPWPDERVPAGQVADAAPGGTSEASCSAFRREVESAINRHSMENGSNTPDFILANYLQNCLSAFDIAVKQRDNWYGIEPRPGWSGPNESR